jgi:VanZ family protein
MFALLAMAVGLAALTGALAAFLASDATPARARELWGTGVSLAGAALLAAALFWLGAAPAWLGTPLLRQVWLAMGLPVWAAGAGLVTWGLLRASTVSTGAPAAAADGLCSPESALACAGIALMLILGSAVAAALYTTRAKTAAKCVLFLALIGGPWALLALLLFNAAINLTWPATAALALLVLIVGMNAAALGHGLRRFTWRRLLAGLLITGASAPIGWLLVSAALGSRAGESEAAGALQAILAPDAAPLSTSSLMLRWCVAHVCTVAILAWGHGSALALLGRYEVEEAATPRRRKKTYARTSAPRVAPPAPPPDRAGRAYLALALAYAGFIIYGSLVPLDFRDITLEVAWSTFWTHMTFAGEVFSRSDFVANILLGVPLGFFCMGLLTRENARRARWAAALATLAIAVLVGAAAEFGQVYIPERTTSLGDILAQTIGAGIGCTVWFLAGAYVTCYVRGLWAEYVQDEQALKILGGYAVMYVIYQLLPFDITIQPADLYHKFTRGQVNFIPFADRAALTPYLIAVQAAVIVPIGYAVVLLRRGRRHPVWTAAIAGFLYAGAIEALQLFILPRYSSATDAVMGAVGGALGGWLATRFGPAARPGLTATPFWARYGGWLKLLVALGALSGIAAVKWHTLGFAWPQDGFWEHVGQAVSVPLTTFYYQTELNAAAEVAREFLAFLFLGLVLRGVTAPLAGRPWLADLVAMLASAAAATVLEAGMLFIPERGVDPASALIEMAGGVIGVMLYRHFVRTFIDAPPVAGAADNPWSAT